MPDARPEIRQIGRSLALASGAATTPDGLGIARLTAGLDPDKADPSTPDFRFGAAAALAAVLNGLAEQRGAT